MTAQNGSSVISPITTFLENDSTLLGKFANLGLGISTLDEFEVDYIDSNNPDLAKLAQLLYMVQKNNSLKNQFKSSLSSNNPSNLTTLFSLAESDVNATMGSEASNYRTLLHTIRDYSGTPANFESALKDYKYVLNSSSNTLTHNGTTYGMVISPYTGKIWLDRNLGASQICTSRSDSDCYGDFYQWGREYDGHQESNSTTTSTVPSTITSVGSDFIIDTGFDWVSTDSNGSLRSDNWSKTDGSSICPNGFRVPTLVELKAETIDQGVSNAIDAFENFLKLPSAGIRAGNTGSLANQGTNGSLWASTIDVDSAKNLLFTNSIISASFGDRINGQTVRCIKD